MSITDRFVVGVVDALPKDGLDKLDKLIDENKVTKESLAALLQEYDIDPLEVLKPKKGMEEVL